MKRERPTAADRAPGRGTVRVPRERLDTGLVRRGLAASREKAVRLVLAGAVMVDGRRVDKAGALIAADATVEVASAPRFVSRGGDKLAHALDAFDVPVKGRTCLDVGASTGGFTHCLLERGAAHVYAVDVGHGQLDATLRSDPRVVMMERVNARALRPDAFPTPPALASVDVSFISLEKILPAVFGALTGDGEAVVLVKPQFEVGKGLVGKGGVVRDTAQQRKVLERVARFAILHGWHVRAVTVSPLRGPKGNREFFLHVARTGRTAPDLLARLDHAVTEEPT